MKKTLATICVLALILSMSLTAFATGLGPALQEIKDTGKLVIGQFDNHPPWFFTVPDAETGGEKYEGFEKYMVDDIAEIIREHLGLEALEVEFMTTSVSGVLAALQAGKVQFAMSLAPTTERRQAYDFTDLAYHRSLQVIGILKENADDPKYAPENGLAGCKIAAPLGSSTAVTCKEKYPNSEIVEYENGVDCLIAMLENKVDGYVLNEKAAILYSAANPQMQIAEGLSFKIPIERDPASCLAFQYGNDDLKALLNDYITRILSDGTFKGFEKRAIDALDDPTLLQGYNMDVNLGGEDSTVTK